jgi:hypothetical protein
MSEGYFIQAAFAHLTLAFRLLDKAGANISAAHTSAAIDGLHAEIERRNLPISLNHDLDFSYLDRLVDEFYGKEGQIRALGAPDKETGR